MLFRTFKIAGLLFVFLDQLRLAQSERAVIGTVFDETGAVLPGVTVELTTDTRQVVAVTDNTGSYRFDAVVSVTGRAVFSVD